MAVGSRRTRPGRTAIVAAMAAAVLLAGCDSKDSRITFDGFYFKTKSKKASDDFINFNVWVQKATQSIDNARKAGLHEGTRYCIDQFGTSRIHWAVGPDTPNERLVLDKDTLIFSGACNP